MAILNQSSAYTRMFFMASTTDHVTGVTGLSPAVSLSKAGGTWAAAAGTVTESSVANGFYKVALTTVDTNTVGDLAYFITAATADPNPFVDQVGPVPANMIQILSSGVTNGTAQLGVNVVTYATGKDPLITQLTESYAVNGVAPTLAQATFAIHQMLMDFSIGGTSYTVKKLDNITTAFVVTLNDPSNPTAASRP